MKKFIIIFCTVCISVSAIAQQGVRFGNLEFIVRKADSDTIVVNEPCPPCPPANGKLPKANPLTRRTYSDSFGAIGFILPDNGNGYYSILGGNSFNIDIGQMRRYHFSRRFALGGTTQYSFYNYRIHQDVFLGKTEIGVDIVRAAIRKQVYRSHNLAIGAFTRFYIVPPSIHSGRIRDNSGMYFDLGAQGDFAFSKYHKVKFQTTGKAGKDKFRDGHAFNAFSASATARLGWDKSAVFVRYRFTDAFNQKVLPMDLPQITIGGQKNF